MHLQCRFDQGGVDFNRSKYKEKNLIPFYPQVDEGYDQISDFLARPVHEDIVYNAMVTKIITKKDGTVKLE